MSETIPAPLARRIRLVVLDVDGVMTDGGIYMGRTEAGETVELKRFEITDQLGVKLLDWAGFQVVFVSGRVSAASRARADELGIACYEGPGGHKLEIVERLHRDAGIGWDETACVCDDLADLPILARAALPVAVSNAVPEVRAVAAWQTRRRGGDGAVREFAEALLRARGEYVTRIEAYVRERGDRG
ncbi:MAG TPA: HAD hydrolase family protein [Longimicrobiales bacterium]|nr:HAD hydrolase family protein [Longimicrobiales bacterium]